MKNALMHACFVAAVLLTNACSKTNNVDVGSGGGDWQEGMACEASEQCADGTCVAGFCRRPCSSDTMCPTDSICLGDGTASGCRLADEAHCAGSCANEALACGIDGTCRMPCTNDTDCARDGSVCIASTCVNHAEAGAALTWFACPEGTTEGLVCDGAKLVRCNGDRPGPVDLDTCASDALCDAAVKSGTSACAPPVCQTGQAVCEGASGAVLGICAADLAGFEDTVECATPALCEQLRADVQSGTATAPYVCPEPVCNVGEVRCSNGDVLTCNTGQTGFATKASCTAPQAQCNPGEASCFHLDLDTREVSRAEYKAFLDAVAQGATPTLPQACAGHADFAPVGLSDWPDVATSAGDRPITHVDWCDASAYCAWKGRRLCGRIGGGSVPAASFADPGESQWMNACSSGGQYSATYGDWDGAGHADTCNTNTSAVAAVGSHAQCHSPVPGYADFLDLMGNVAEWEDACTSGGQCHVRGGSFASNLVLAQLGCAADRLLDRTARAQDVGFRCCGP